MKLKHKLLAFFPSRIRLPLQPDRRLYGEVGEAVAAALLKRKGYKILAKNFKSAKNEIDIIAKRKRIISFVEVKARTVPENGNGYLSMPSEALSPSQMTRIKSCARSYLSRNASKISECEFTYDVVEIYIEKGEGYRFISKVNHIISAFK